jgi:T-complex protein 1 subunit alpha
MSLALDGERTSGEDIRTQNVTACMAVANIVKSSLGPVGLDKMLVDEAGEVTVTNDGATILQQLEVEHPAAKVLVELADLQDQEVGDGTTSVVIVASELLKRANELLKSGVHATNIMAGYRMAMKESVKFIKSSLLVPTEGVERSLLMSAAKTSMSSKIIGGKADFFAEMVVDAVTRVRRENAKGKAFYPIKSINILKSHGKSSFESALVKGYALNCVKKSQAMPTRVVDAKIALLDFNLQKHRMQLGVTVLVSDPKKLEAIRQREADITKEKIQKILDAGANVILTTKGIDDLCAKYLVEAGAIGVHRCKKEDLNRIASATGATVLPNLADLEGEETFDPAYLGFAGEVAEERVGDGELIFIRDMAEARAALIVLRGANEFMLEEMHRSLWDSLNVVKRVLESKSLVAGGGSVECALSVYLDSFATTLGSKEQLAIKEFAQALLVIPKTLAVNAAQDATDLVAKLCAYHHAAQTKDDKKHYAHYGLDLVAGAVVDNLARGVVEPSMSKVKSLRFATEAAITILRIDDMIKINPPEQDPRGGHGH